jgi:hypothetical protein
MALFRFGPDDVRVLERLRPTHALPDYLSAWTGGCFGPSYIAARHSVGEIHQALGVHPAA